MAGRKASYRTARPCTRPGHQRPPRAARDVLRPPMGWVNMTARAMSRNPSDSEPFAGEDSPGLQKELRHRISTALLARADAVSADSVAMFPFSGAETLNANYCKRLGTLLVQLLATAVGGGRLDPRDGSATDLYRVALDRSLPIDKLFTFVYLVERTALDELALDEGIGATSEPWPLVAQMVRRGSFDLLAAYTERAHLEPSGAAIIDRLTTLHTRPVFEAALAKVLDRAGRFGDPLSIILFDVDRLAAINSAFGYGVGDRILERLGILIRGFFRQHDWIARYAEDAIAVILSRTEAEDATGLAERVRVTVQERLEFLDHRTEQPVRVTISAAVVNIAVTVGDVLDPNRVLADAEAALDRAKRQGGNCVERVASYGSRSS
jgi:diguanylate cyclase (GGDEF)-like protein